MLFFLLFEGAVLIYHGEFVVFVGIIESLIYFTLF